MMDELTGRALTTCVGCVPRGDVELELEEKRLAFEQTKKEFDTATKKAKGVAQALQESVDSIHEFQVTHLKLKHCRDRYMMKV